VRGFSLADAPALTSDQQAWVVATLTSLNTLIGAATGTTCPSWQDPGTNLQAAVSCFQGWYNANSGGTLPTDGNLDPNTVQALVATTQAHPSDFGTQFPSGAAPASDSPVPPDASAAATPAPPAAPTTAAAAPSPVPPSASSALDKFRNLSTPAKVGIGLAGVALVAGVVHMARKKGGSRSHGHRAAPSAAPALPATIAKAWR